MGWTTYHLGRKCKHESCQRQISDQCETGYCPDHFRQHCPTSTLGMAGDPDLQMPASWKDLPESTDMRADLLWAYNNMLHIRRREGKSSLIYWGRCSEPPSKGAHVRLSFADSNLAAFLQAVDRATGLNVATNEEDQRGERRAVEEVRKILTSFKGE